MLSRSAYRCEQLFLSISGKTDEELIELLSSAPFLESAKLWVPGRPKPCVPAVHLIAHDTIAKRAYSPTADQEYLSTEFVRNRTCIPVPRAERKIKTFNKFDDTYIVQQYIPGDLLGDVWPSLSWWKRFRVALTLRYYIHQLRQLQPATGSPSFPGPPSAEGMPLVCTGRFFTSNGAGPFSSYRELERWYNNRLLVVQRFRGEGLGATPFDSTSPLSFTHMDLHLRNIILGRDGQLWVIDWAEAGWYPSWFEGASMRWWLSRRPTLVSWGRMLPFITGPYDKPGQLPFLWVIAYSLEMMPANIINLASLLVCSRCATARLHVSQIDS